MATVNFNFTAVGVGDNLQLIAGDKFSYSVSGTFVGKVVLEQSTDGGKSWKRIGDPITSADSSVLTVNYGGSDVGVHRFQCTEYTSGTIETSIADVDVVLFDVKDNRLEQIFKVTEAGVEIEGTILQNGSPLSSGMALDFSNHTASSVDIDLGTNKLVNVVDPTAAQDAATMNYVDTQISGIDLSGKADTDLSNIAPSADVDFNTQKLINVVDPTAAQDAATKNYVDGISTGDLWSDDVDSTIAPASGDTGTYDLGASGQDFGNAFVNVLKNTSDNIDAITLSVASRIQVHQNIIPATTAAHRLGLDTNVFSRAYVESIYMTVGGNPALTFSTSGQVTLLQDFIPNNGTRDLGSATNNFAETHTNQVISNAGLTITADPGNDVTLAGQKLDGNAMTDAWRVPNLTADPGSPANGDLWYNTTSNQLKAYVNGSVTVLA